MTNIIIYVSSIRAHEVHQKAYASDWCEDVASKAYLLNDARGKLVQLMAGLEPGRSGEEARAALGDAITGALADAALGEAADAIIDLILDRALPKEGV